MTPSEARTLLTSSDNPSRQQAAEWLSQNADVAMELAVELVEHSGDDDRVVAEYCVATLEELGEPSPNDLPALCRLLASDNSDVAYWAATLIGRCGEQSAACATQLGNLVASDAAPATRERAAWAIAKIGPAASSAKPQLESLSITEPESLARAIAKALAAIES
ncbi:HEAT repeat domain-containing protein [Aeoliella mucimassa]|uniref:HEAT repeat protein n=1 Tax=Aeoliella mucimassa TaxID=2527972 RepID=A0A518AL51_9BACT|nr:HEAT repeat domain-containing protein [Aeoliella mucimassa]QDU55465.1 hypothetical protein Pan181_16540 [Aeoliella mucimassa]